MSTTDSPIWNVEEMERAVSALLGPGRWNKAHPSVRSVVDRSHFAHFHYTQARRVLRNRVARRHSRALVNTSKHRSIIRPSLSDSMRGPAQQRYTLNLQPFEYGDTPYPAIDAISLMVPEHARMQPLTVDLSIALTRAVQDLA